MNDRLRDVIEYFGPLVARYVTSERRLLFCRKHYRISYSSHFCYS